MSTSFRNLFLFVALTSVFLVLATTNAQISTTDGTSTDQNHASSDHAYFGIQMAPVPPIIQAHLPEVVGEGGVLIVEVPAGSPAKKAGLKPHDIVTRFDGQLVNSPEELVSRVKQMKPDDKVSVEYIRGGKMAEASVVLGTAPETDVQPVQSTAEESELESIWKRPFSFWLDSPGGKKQTLEFNRRERDRQNSPATWSKFQSMNVTKSVDGTYTVKVEYQENDKDLKREFTGTREAIRDEINNDEELPDESKKHLLRSLDQQTPDMFRFDWPQSFQEMLDRDWDDFQIPLRY